jgi:hypothetical protein
MLGFIGTAAAENQQWWPVRNDSGEQVPAFGCMRITGMFSPFTSGDLSFQRVGVANMGFTIGKPNTYASQYFHLLNGPRPIESGAVGQGVFGRVMLGRYNGFGFTVPAAGNILGPKNGSWDLWSGIPGFTVVDGMLEDTYDSSDVSTVRIMQSPALFLKGTANAAIGPFAGPGLVTVDINGNQVTATYTGYPEIANGDAVYLHWYGNSFGGTWYASKP